ISKCAPVVNIWMYWAAVRTGSYRYTAPAFTVCVKKLVRTIFVSGRSTKNPTRARPGKTIR
ncbi:MAG: hypothetical protein ACE5PO_04675, partial [Candidatus Bathyarchaeia archaeon]